MRGAVAGAWARDRYGVTAKQTKKVDAVQYCVDRMTFLAGEIKAKQAAARAVPDPAAFVTFADRRTQVLAAPDRTCTSNATVASAPGLPMPYSRAWAVCFKCNLTSDLFNYDHKPASSGRNSSCRQITRACSACSPAPRWHKALTRLVIAAAPCR